MKKPTFDLFLTYFEDSRKPTFDLLLSGFDFSAVLGPLEGNPPHNLSFAPGKHPKQSFAPCKRLFWDSPSGGPKKPFALSLSTFGHFGCFDTCSRTTGSQVSRHEL